MNTPLLRDLRDRYVGQFQELAGLLHSQPRQVNSGRHADALLEHTP